MSEMFPTTTVWVYGADTQDGANNLNLNLYTRAPNNPSHVCVLDSVTWAYKNTSEDAVTLRLDVVPTGQVYAQWRAYATVPAGESVTIDKSFVHGMPIWRAAVTTLDLDNDESRGQHNANTGPSMSGTGTGVYAGFVYAYVDEVAWNTGTPHGPGHLSATFHVEPASARRY